MSNELTRLNPEPVSIGAIANAYAEAQTFPTYQERLARYTVRRQKSELSTFARYLTAAGLPRSTEELHTSPAAWSDMTHGLVDGFVRYLLQQGYAIGSVNLHLSTVKVYCTLAARAGCLSVQEVALIRMQQGFSHRQGLNVDEKREKSRRGHKKAEPILVSLEQADQLKGQPDTPQGRRDAFLMCLLLDHGLRCSELATLLITDVSADTGLLHFYRKKVDKQQIHELTPDTRLSLQRYLEVAEPSHHLFMGSRKGGQLVGRMSERAITARVGCLCERVGVEGASAHDGRHAWATFAVAAGTDIKALQDAGGWNSPVMPLRYAASASIANRGVKFR